MKLNNAGKIVILTACCLFLCVLHVACDPSSSIEEEKDIEIVEPLTGDELSRLNNNKIVVRFNEKNVVTPMDRYYSYDRIDWKSIEESWIGREESSTGDPVIYRYAVLLWKPIDYSLATGDSIYIKVNSYGDQKLFHIIGPVTIE